MRIIIKITFVFIIAFISGCQRQLLEEQSQVTALIPISFDWSESNVPIEETEAVSIYFFPKDGGEPIVHVSNNIHEAKVSLLVGKYSVLIFNETIYESSWTGISFVGTDNYNTFAAVARKNSTFRGNPLYAKSDDENIVRNPDPLAVWSLDDFEVTRDMITRTRSKVKSNTKSLTENQTKAVDESLEVFSGIKPQPRTAKLTTNIKIKNLNNVHTLTGAVKGMASGVYLVSREKISTTCTQLYTFDHKGFNWSDERGVDGNAIYSMITFGKASNVNAVYKYQLDAILLSGENPKPWQWDVTDKVNQSSELHIIINIGNKENEGDKDVDLGELKDAVHVGDWNNENIEIQ